MNGYSLPLFVLVSSRQVRISAGVGRWSLSLSWSLIGVVNIRSGQILLNRHVHAHARSRRRHLGVVLPSGLDQRLALLWVVSVCDRLTMGWLEIVKLVLGASVVVVVLIVSDHRMVGAAMSSGSADSGKDAAGDAAENAGEDREANDHGNVCDITLCLCAADLVDGTAKLALTHWNQPLATI